MNRILLSIVLVALGCSSNGDKGGDETGGADMTASAGGGEDGGIGTGGGQDGGGKDGSATVTDCDPLAQTGCPADAPRCVISAGQGGVTTSCVADGTVADGQTCMRTGTGGGMGGNRDGGMGTGTTGAPDNCMKGEACVTASGSLLGGGGGGGAGGAARVCRKYCQADSDCGTGNLKCAFSVAGMDLLDTGVCIPTCTPFGQDCASGEDCSSSTYGAGTTADGTTVNRIFYCRALGAGPFGQPYDSCAGQAAASCPAGTVCTRVQQASLCLPLCDTAHACPVPAGSDGGMPACEPLGTSGSIGLCDPT